MEDAFKMYNKYGVKNIKTGYVNDVSKNIKVNGENGEISKKNGTMVNTWLIIFKK